MDCLLEYVFPKNSILFSLQVLVVEYWMPDYALPYLIRWAQRPMFTKGCPYLIEEGETVRVVCGERGTLAGKRHEPWQQALRECGVDDAHPDDLPRHNLFLLIAYDRCQRDPDVYSYFGITVDYIPADYVSAYRFNLFEGVETVYVDQGEAVRQFAQRSLRKFARDDDASAVRFVRELREFTTRVDKLAPREETVCNDEDEGGETVSQENDEDEGDEPVSRENDSGMSSENDLAQHNDEQDRKRKRTK